MKYEQDTIKYEKEDPNMVKMKELISKYRLKITFLRMKNKDFKEVAQKVAEEK